MRGYTYIYTLKTSPRVVSCACVIGGSCTNCGVSRTTNGLCSRCLDLPYCKKCKRHLSYSSFNGEQRHICQVHLHVTITCILHTGTSRIIISQVAIATRFLVYDCSQNCEKRRTVRRIALNNVIAETSLPVTEFDTSFETLINTRQRAIENIVRDALQHHEYWRVCSSIVCSSVVINRCKFIPSFTFRVSLIPFCIFYRSVHIQLNVDAELVRELPDGQLSRITAYFHTPSVVVNVGQPLDLHNAITVLNNALEHFNTRGSGFVLEYVKRFVVSVLRYRPLHGSTYIPTPSFLAAKRCIVNVQKFNDSKCFLWSVLSALHEPKINKQRLTNYTSYESTLDMTGINYPVQTKQIPLFEKQNPTISINVLSFEPDTRPSQ